MEAYLAVALKEIKHLKLGENFTLKGLFRDYEWEDLDIMKRTILERMFMHAIENGEAKGIIILKKNEKDEQIYQKESF